MRNTKLSLNKFAIYGLKNQKLIIVGERIKDNQQLEIYLDRNKIDYNIYYEDDTFYIETIIPKRTKKVKLVLKENNNSITSVSTRNLMIKRLISKVKEERNNTSKNRKRTTYYTYPEIGIQECMITGIKRPLFHVQGTSSINDYKFKVLVDNKEIDYDLIPLGDDKSFCINAKLEKKVKMVSLILITDNEDITILKYRNKLLNRVKLKLKFILRKVIGIIKSIIRVLVKGIKFLWREHHFLVPPALWKKYFKLFIERLKGGQTEFYNPFNVTDYNNWLKENEEEIIEEIFDYNPLISILIPVYNINREYLSECIDSILAQTYDNFEVCLVDDHSTNQETIDTLNDYLKKDSRIKVHFREENGHISNATNDALKMAKGEFVGLVDNDDLLTKNALSEVVKVLNQNRNLDMIYSDEDKINTKGFRCDPHFKPDFSPDTLMSLNYICHFTVLRKSIMDEIGGFTVGLEGAQDHDLFLRFTEKTNKVHHIPKILYHWRMIPTSTSMSIDNKSYANDKGKIAIENALKRRNLEGTVTKDLKSTYYIVDYKLKYEPLISIIIPTRDYAETLDTCLKSLFEKTTYKNYEVIVVNNNSVEEETFNLFENYKSKYKNFKVIDANFEFNYSKINNLAVNSSDGEYIVLLNNDTEIITGNWLEQMVGYASLPHIGAVGPKLLYPDTTVQHAGVILGLGGVASHAYIGSKREELGMYGRLRVPYNYSAVTAACLMVKKDKFIEVGGLEEDLMVAYNDMDFNIKLLQKGYYNICLPQVELFHFESKSRGLDTTTEKYKRFVKESEYMFDKWFDVIMNDKYYNKNFTLRGFFVLDKEERILPDPIKTYLQNRKDGDLQ